MTEHLWDDLVRRHAPSDLWCLKEALYEILVYPLAKENSGSVLTLQDEGREFQAR